MTDVIYVPYRGTKADVAYLDGINDDTPTMGAVWDHLALHGPLSRDDIGQANPLTGHAGTWREYERFHPEVTAKDADRLLGAAAAWYLNFLIDRGLRRGWIEERDGLLYATTPPERHTPLSTYGGKEGAVARLTDDRETVAAIRKFLAVKAHGARRTPDKDGRKMLYESLDRYGILAPIFVWPGNTMKGIPEIVLDGQTRIEWAEERGVDWTPKRTTVNVRSALDALQMRFDFEMGRKRLNPEDRAAYAEAFQRAGLSQRDIAARLSVSLGTVNAALSGAGVQNRTRAPEHPVEEWAEARDSGATFRDIANEYGVAHSTVLRALAKWDAKQDGAELPPLPAGKGRTALALIAAYPGRYISTTVRDVVGIKGGQVISKMVEAGLIEVGDDRTLEASPEALVQLSSDEIAEAAALVEPVKPKAEPKAPKPKADPEPDPEPEPEDEAPAPHQHQWVCVVCGVIHD